MKKYLLDFLKEIPVLTEEEAEQIGDEIDLQAVEKGTVLLRQGDIPEKCYFVLKGCVRQYSVTEEGGEHTVNFFTENQAVMIFQNFEEGELSEFSLVCAEDSLLIVGLLCEVDTMFGKFPKLSDVTRVMMEQNFQKVQKDFALFMSSSPEQRYRNVAETRPELLTRVPQHQLASYLGITAESLSRIKKRLSGFPSSDKKP